MPAAFGVHVELVQQMVEQLADADRPLEQRPDASARRIHAEVESLGAVQDCGLTAHTSGELPLAGTEDSLLVQRESIFHGADLLAWAAAAGRGVNGNPRAPGPGLSTGREGSAIWLRDSREVHNAAEEIRWNCLHHSKHI